MDHLIISDYISGWWFEPLWKIWKSIGMIIPNIWDNAKNGNQTTNQLWVSKPPHVWHVEKPIYDQRFHGRPHLYLDGLIDTQPQLANEKNSPEITYHCNWYLLQENGTLPHIYIYIIYIKHNYILDIMYIEKFMCFFETVPRGLYVSRYIHFICTCMSR